MEYYSAIKRNKIVPFAEMWMNLETVTHSKVSQKEKNKYCILMGFPGSLVGKESACNAGDPDSIPGLGRSAGEGIGLHVCGIQKNCTDELIGKAEIETQT